jgi:hypothetical protein
MKERGRKEKREKDRRSREKGKDRRGRKEGSREEEVQGQAKWIVTRCERRIESHSDNRNYKKCR